MLPIEQAGENLHGVAEPGSTPLLHKTNYDRTITQALESGLFDPDFYRDTCALPSHMSSRELVQHYLEVGERDGKAPSVYFDPKFYLAVNPDVRAAATSPLMHYLKRGQSGGRYRTRAQLHRDCMNLISEGYVHEGRRFSGGILADANGLSALEAHLAYGWREGHRFLAGFDDRFYAETYLDARTGGRPPLIHYLKVGRAENRFCNRADLDAAVKVISEEFDKSHYEKYGLIDPALKDPIVDYLVHGWKLGRDPNSQFSSSYYLGTAKDILAAGLEPFSHYIAHGKAEGRASRQVTLTYVKPGRQVFNSEKPTVIVCCHDASRTGAPLLGLELGRQLSSKFNIVFLSLRGGPLTAAMLDECSFLANVGPDRVYLKLLLQDLLRSFPITGVILNSVETVDYASACLSVGLPTVALIHEYADYTLPKGKVELMTAQADVAVFPAESVQQSATLECVAQFKAKPSNMRVRHQGRLESWGHSIEEQRAALSADDLRRKINPLNDPSVRIVLGAGQVQIRKGVDLFVLTAAEVKKRVGNKIKFVWVGGGYDPKSDVINSVWLKSAVDRLNLSEVVYFIPHQNDLAGCLDASDIFFLSSRLDPFPNVVVDAISAGKRVICYKEGTGVAEWIEKGRIEGATVNYCDVNEAADRIIDLAAVEDRKSLKNELAATEHFSFEDYTRDIEKLLAEAVEIRRKIVASAEMVAASGQFDFDYYTAGDRTRRFGDAVLEYTAMTSKGLVGLNPCPGFSDGEFRDGNRSTPGEVPLLAAIARSGRNFRTHRCISLGKSFPDRPPMRVAVHLHLHYSELSSEFAERFSGAIPEADLFVTVTSDEGKRAAQAAFARAQCVTVEVVPNMGRDILPMLSIFNRYKVSQNYEVFGHFHGKKTVTTKAHVGPLWRKFLLDTLVGDRDIMTEILGLFSRERKLGLVFAEDRNSVGWTENRQLAEFILSRVKPTATMADFPIFPVGTMFWARPRVVEPLANAIDWIYDKMPAEPLEDDGTILHAIERIIPSLTEAVDLSWATVRRAGVNRVF